MKNRILGAALAAALSAPAAMMAKGPTKRTARKRRNQLRAKGLHRQAVR